MTAKIIAIVGVSVGAVIAMFIGGWLVDRSPRDSEESNRVHQETRNCHPTGDK